MIWMDDGTLRFEGEVIRADTPTPGGHVYPIGVVRKMFSEAMEANPVFVVMDPGPGAIRLSDAVGVVDSVTISKEGVVTGKGRMLDTFRGQKVIAELRAMGGISGGPYRKPVNISVGMSVMTTATVEDDGTISDARLVGVELFEK